MSDRHPNAVVINGNVLGVLRDWQKALVDTLFAQPEPGSAMTVAAMLHRSAGKTYLASLVLFLSCLACTIPGAKAAFVAPHLKQARSLMKNQIEEFAAEAGIKLKWDATDNQFIFPNGAILLLGATENNAHELLRGNRIEIGMVLDEAGFMGDAMPSLLPMLKGGRAEGWLLALGTPSSLGDPLSVLYQKGLDPAVPNHAALRYSVYDTGLMDETAIEHWRLSFKSENDWRREGLADPEAGDDEAVCPISLVRDAQRRDTPPGGFAFLQSLPHVMGIDPSFGGDECALVRRRGNVVYPAISLPSGNAVTTAGAIGKMMDDHSPDAVFIDAGGGGRSIADILNGWGYEITVVDFGSKSPEAGFAQMRSWMWWKMREFLGDAVLPVEDPDLAQQLTGPTFKYVASTGAGGRKIQVEKKEEMKKRGLSSPDRADALALACAFPVQKTTGPEAEWNAMIEAQRSKALSETDYEPLGGF